MDKDQILLLELLLIRAKYTNDELDSVAELIKNNDELNTLGQVVSLLSKLEIPTKRKNPAGKKKEPDILDLLKQSNPEYYTVLMRFQSKLLNREVLPEAQMLRRVAGELGAPVLTRREQTIRSILNALAVLPKESGLAIIQRELEGSKESSNDFKTLADAILRRET